MPRVGGDSKSTILDAALALFSERGYSATSVRDIAAAVGIKAASLYNHFSGKQNLFDALIAREVAYVEETVRAEGAIAHPSESPQAYSRAYDADIQSLVWKSYRPFFADERIGRLRRLLAMGRYDDSQCERLYRTIFIERPVQLQEAIFSHLIQQKLFEECDTRLAAEEFHGFMYMLMDMNTPAENAETLCRQHVVSFNEAHTRKAGR